MHGGASFRPLGGKYYKRPFENVVLGLQFLYFAAKAFYLSFNMLRDGLSIHLGFGRTEGRAPAVELPHPEPQRLFSDLEVLSDFPENSAVSRISKAPFID